MAKHWEDEEVDEHINNVIGAGVAEAAKVAADLRIPEIDRGAALSITQMQIEEVEVL